MNRPLSDAWFVLGALVALSPVLFACGGEKWLPADTASATVAVRAEVRVEEICAADGGSCDPALVRALVRMPLCEHASMLAHHGQTVPDLRGVACQPK